MMNRDRIIGQGRRTTPVPRPSREHWHPCPGGTWSALAHRGQGCRRSRETGSRGGPARQLAGGLARILHESAGFFSRGVSRFFSHIDRVDFGGVMPSAVEPERLKGVCEGALGRAQVAKLSATLRTGSRVHVVGVRRAESGYPALRRCTSSRNTAWCAHVLDSRTATVRVFRVTTAPMRSNRSRRVWHCARASSVPPSAVRRIVSTTSCSRYGRRTGRAAAP